MQQTGSCNQKELKKGWWDDTLQPLEVNKIGQISLYPVLTPKIIFF